MLNQTKKKLLENVKTYTDIGTYTSRDVSIEINRGRIETREIFVYDCMYAIEDKHKWNSVKEVIKVHRTTYPKKEPNKVSQEIRYYISSKYMDAKEYNYGIRAHWSIENSLHYVKDVILGEDRSLIRTGNAPANFSIIRNIVLNIFRAKKFHDIAKAIRLIGGNIPLIISMLE